MDTHMKKFVVVGHNFDRGMSAVLSRHSGRSSGRSCRQARWRSRNQEDPSSYRNT